MALAYAICICLSSNMYYFSRGMEQDVANEQYKTADW